MGKAIWEQEDRAGLMDVQLCFHMEPVLEDTPIILCSAASIIVTSEQFYFIFILFYF